VDTAAGAADDVINATAANTLNDNVSAVMSENQLRQANRGLDPSRGSQPLASASVFDPGVAFRPHRLSRKMTNRSGA
jgi:hypothetical protein